MLVGEVRSGTVVPEMLVSIRLNSATSVTVRIKAIGYWENTKHLALSLECEEADEAELIRALDISGEELSCRDTAEGTPE